MAHGNDALMRLVRSAEAQPRRPLPGITTAEAVEGMRRLSGLGPSRVRCDYCGVEREWDAGNPFCVGCGAKLRAPEIRARPKPKPTPAPSFGRCRDCGRTVDKPGPCVCRAPRDLTESHAFNVVMTVVSGACLLGAVAALVWGLVS